MRRLMRILSGLLWFSTRRRVHTRTHNIEPQEQHPADLVPRLSSLRYRIRFSTQDHEWIIHASDEREAALKAENVLRQLHEQLLPVHYRMEAPVGAEATRLARYLDDVTREVEMSV